MKPLDSLFQSGEITDGILDATIESPAHILSLDEFVQTVFSVLSEGLARHHSTDFMASSISALAKQYPDYAREMEIVGDSLKIKNEIISPWLKNHALATRDGEGNLSEAIATAGEVVAKSMGTLGKCYRGVKQSLKEFGVDLVGGEAWQAADQLANDARFVEITVSRDDLGKLPRGAIVVWGKSAAKPYGHISIALGNSKEASDHVQNQIVNGYQYSGFRVFVARGTGTVQ